MFYAYLTYETLLPESLYESVYHPYLCVYVCWLACEMKIHGLHAGPQQALDGSEDDVVVGDIASYSSDLDVLGGL